MNIYIVYHSQTGTTHLLAKAIEEGAKRRQGAHVFLRRIPEVQDGFIHGDEGFPGDIVTKEKEVLVSAMREYHNVPEYKLDELKNADSLILGSPVHYANPSAAVQSFLEHLTPLWEKKDLTDKPCGVFVTSNTLHGGKENTMMSMIGGLMAFSMIPVGLQSQATYMYKFGSIFGPTATGIPTAENKSLGALFGERVANIAFAMQFGKKAEELKQT